MSHRADRAATVPRVCPARHRATVPTVPPPEGAVRRRHGTVREWNGDGGEPRHGTMRYGGITPADDISYVLFGEPLPMPRPRVGRWGVKPPSGAILELKSRHAEAALLARPNEWLLSGPTFAVHVVAYRATRRQCDVDNLAKLPLDALTGIAWNDDSQVTRLVVEKRRDGDDPRTEVRVVRL